MEKKKGVRKEDEAAQYHPGPSPIVTLAIILAIILLLGMIFAAIKVFLLS